MCGIAVEKKKITSKYPNYFQRPSKLIPNKQKEGVSFILPYMIPQILNSKKSKLEENK